MNETDAINRIRDHALSQYPNYPVEDLTAARFDIGWTVFPQNETSTLSTLKPGQPLFLIGDSGDIMEVSGSLPPHKRVAEFRRRFGDAS